MVKNVIVVSKTNGLKTLRYDPAMFLSRDTTPMDLQIPYETLSVVYYREGLSASLS